MPSQVKPSHTNPTPFSFLFSVLFFFSFFKFFKAQSSLRSFLSIQSAPCPDEAVNCSLGPIWGTTKVAGAARFQYRTRNLFGLFRSSADSPRSWEGWVGCWLCCCYCANCAACPASTTGWSSLFGMSTHRRGVVGFTPPPELAGRRPSLVEGYVCIYIRSVTLLPVPSSQIQHTHAHTSPNTVGTCYMYTGTEMTLYTSDSREQKIGEK
ncbi:hypothetical protein B0T24DRAFT_635093 [Lasiosphaeria ovina]|uniref:Uncharacterized protein n=1 Tax=Lasiosphaeria ovina TaxID=92902 RepID=A0AAE0K024_9PEZI|nr:hypothetical protein B0T24DRAFT_635093 [Lasiosphaeria ovina]